MYTIGVDLGGTNIAIGLCDENLNIVDKDSVKTLANREADLIIKDMANLAEKILSRNNLSTDDVEYVGIAAPGAVESATGFIKYVNNLPMSNYNIAEAFKKFLPVKKVLLANDANAAALGESLCGASKGTKNSIMITLGTGVGGGVILDGKIFEGGLNPQGTELGHMVIVAGGRQCSCGRRGCLEAYCSASALTRITNEKMFELKTKNISSLLFDEAEKDGEVSAKTAFSAMQAGDKYGSELVNDYITYLGCGLANLVNIFQPEIITIGGGVCRQGENLTRPLTEIVDSEQYTRGNKVKTKIVTAKLGNDAGIIGAAGLGK